MRNKRLKVGILGCGTIGTEIALASVGRLRGKVVLAGISDEDRSKAEGLRKKLKGIRIFDQKELIRKSDLVVEAASAKAVRVILTECLKRKRDILVMSVGGLLNDPGLLAKVRRAGSKVYLPSGAICGIDGIKAASIGTIRSVSLTTRKPPKSLEGAPYILKKGIDLKKIDKETILFDGTASEAVSAFPQNINVAATLSLASIGEGAVRVRVVTSPEY